MRYIRFWWQFPKNIFATELPPKKRLKPHFFAIGLKTTDPVNV
jgi:hypothetical protein